MIQDNDNVSGVANEHRALSSADPLTECKGYANRQVESNATWPLAVTLFLHLAFQDASC